MKKSSIIVVALIIVFALVYFLLKEDKVSVGVKKLNLPVFTAEKVDRVEIKTKDTIKLVKEGEVWKVDIGTAEKPHLVQADQAHVATMLDAALTLKPTHYVTNLKEKHKDLGFFDDNTVIITISSGGQSVWSLVLGASDSGSGKYAKEPENDEIYVIRGSFWSLTRNGLMDWREHALWSVKDNDLKSLTIEKEGTTHLALHKEAGDEHWKIDRTKTKIAPNFREDNHALMALVRTATSLQASGFIDDKRELSSPIATIHAQLSDGTRVLSIYSGQDDKYVAKRSGDDQIFEIAKFAVDKILKPIDELRDLTVLNVDKASIQKLVLKGGKEQVVVAKKDNHWTIEVPAELPAEFEFDQNTVDDIVSMLSNLRAERLAKSGKDVGQNQHWQKDWLVELVNDKGETIHLFADKNKASKDEYVVRGNIDQEVYVIKATRIASLFQGLKAFKKEEFELPPIDENTRGFESLPVDVQRKLLDATKNKKK